MSQDNEGYVCVCVDQRSDESKSLVCRVLQEEQASVCPVGECILRELAAEELEKLNIWRDPQKAEHRCLSLYVSVSAFSVSQLLVRFWKDEGQNIT